jgi:hypothetical protein
MRLVVGCPLVMFGPRRAAVRWAADNGPFGIRTAGFGQRQVSVNYFFASQDLQVMVGIARLPQGHLCMLAEARRHQALC